MTQYWPLHQVGCADFSTLWLLRPNGPAQQGKIVFLCAIIPYFTSFNIFCTLLGVFFMKFNFCNFFCHYIKKVMPKDAGFEKLFLYPQTHILSCMLVYRSQKVYCLWKKLSWIFVLSLTLVHDASKLGLLCISWYEFWYGNIPQWFRLCRSPFSLGRHFLSNTIHFSNHFAPLGCSKLIKFAHFVVIQKISPKSDAERCRYLRT